MFYDIISVQRTKGVLLMATKKQLNEKLRYQFMTYVLDALDAKDYEVLQTNSNQYAIPCVDEEGNDEFMVITFQVPTGSRDGEAYDGYSLADAYAEKVKANEEKAKAAAEKKAAKIAKDKAMREAKAKAKAEHNEAKG
jgi:hypothetical protein